MDEVSLLEKIVSINSITGNENRLAKFLEEQLRQAGFSTKRIWLDDGRFNVVGQRGKKGKPLLFYGHMDTVPPYGMWTHDPFCLTEEDGRLYGLGVFDMKAGVAAVLCACRQASERKVKVAFCADEENISEGAFALLKSGFASDAEAVITGEIASSVGRCLGPRQITLGRRGRCVLEITVPGASAHGAQAARGTNAIEEAARLILHLKKMNRHLGSHPLLPPPTQFVRKISAESTSLSVPQQAILELDRHLVPPQTPESALKQTQAYINSLYAKGKFKEIDGKRIEVRLKPRKTPYLSPYITRRKGSAVKLVEVAVRKHAGPPVYTYGASVADENALALLEVPVIGVGPLGANEHSADEWITKESYLQLVKIFSELMKS
ncbi:MAG: M20/M25/M40 family metallo-hydrolase [Candidatus Anstonellaceae archaeon]